MDSLLSMGFDAATARQALDVAGGNVDRALDILLGGGLNDQINSAETNVGFSNGADTVVDLGVSQYSFGESGTSACTVIACSVIKLLLTRLDSGQDVPDVATLIQAVQSGVSHYQTLPATSRSHLSVDELGSFMTQEVSAVGGAPIQGLLTAPRCFQEMFAQARQMSAPGKHIAIVITKPPETVCVVLPPANAPPNARFIFFDSHSRPQFGFNGAYMAVCDSEAGLVSRLSTTFPPLQMDGGQEDYMQMMYNMFEGSVFQSK